MTHNQSPNKFGLWKISAVTFFAKKTHEKTAIKNLLGEPGVIFYSHYLLFGGISCEI